MVEISIVGATITGNKGAEGMFKSAVQNISEVFPNSRFNLFTYYPKADNAANKNQNLVILSGAPLDLAFITIPLCFIHKMFSFLHLTTKFLERHDEVSALVNSDIVIDMGGITFVDGREKYLIYNVASILPPLLLGKKIVKYSQAMGPFNNKINKYMAKLILPKLDLIIARGEITKRNLDSLNLKNTIIGADAAFTLKINQDYSEVINEYIREDFFEKRIIGISPSSVIDNYCNDNNIDYSRIMAQLIDYQIINNDFNVILLPHSMRKYTLKSKNNDLVISREIHNLVNNKNRCILISDELDAEELRVLISRCDFFFASRFHAMISSLSMGVPTLVCGWSHKYLEVLHMFHLDDYAFDYKNIDYKLLVEKCNSMILNEGEISEKIRAHLPEVTKSSEKNMECIKNLLISYIPPDTDIKTL